MWWTLVGTQAHAACVYENLSAIASGKYTYIQHTRQTRKTELGIRCANGTTLRPHLCNGLCASCRAKQTLNNYQCLIAIVLVGKSVFGASIIPYM